MKNIHLLPTDKPSILGRFIDTNNLFLRVSNDIPRGENVNIYITSDEKIKNRDWCLYNKNHNSRNPDWILTKCGEIESEEMHPISEGKLLLWMKKIILTTDQYLIEDRVQATDDEFLEWFVKNPSCEFINVDEKTPDEIEVELNIHGHDIGLTDREFDEWVNNGGQLYKIIIPKEEPKQETVGEAAKRIALETYGEIFSKYPRGGKLSNETIIGILTVFFRLGSEWQQEKSYSEEDMKQFGLYLGDNLKKLKGKTIDEIFEQFKKK